MNAILYRHFSESDELLYVGASLQFLQRHVAHTSAAAWYCDVSKITLEKYKSKASLLVAERRAIETEKPKYNGTFMKDKIPPYVAPVQVIPYELWSDREKRRYEKLSYSKMSQIINRIEPSQDSARILRLNLNTLYFIKEGRTVP